MKSNQPAKSNRKSYDYTQAVEAMRYVAKLYPDLSLAAYAIYQTMPVFEADKFGFGKPVCIGVRDIAALAHMAAGTVKSALMDLNQAGLLRVEIGQKSKRGVATKLQRVPIKELPPASGQCNTGRWLAGELLSKDSRTTRNVKTLAGKAIALPKRKRPHGGKLLNWVVQGTIADVTTMAGLELLKRENVSSFLYLHDELIVLFEPGEKTSEELRSEVEAEMLRAGQKIGLAFLVSSSGMRVESHK